MKRFAGRWARRSVSLFLIVELMAAQAGVPMLASTEKDRSRPFPCQDRPCGCASADACWRHCCCMTNRQKVAWARQHAITPPDFVVEAAQREDDAAPRPCCAHHKSEKTPHGTSDDAVARQPGSETHSGTHDHAGKSGLRLVVVITDLARQCGGLAGLWSLLTDAIPERAQATWSFDDRIIGRVAERIDRRSSAEPSPPVPPPRLTAFCG